MFMTYFDFAFEWGKKTKSDHFFLPKHQYTCKAVDVSTESWVCWCVQVDTTMYKHSDTFVKCEIKSPIFLGDGLLYCCWGFL